MLYMPADDSDPANEADPGVLSWTEELRRVTVAVSKKDRRPAASRQQLFYLLLWTVDARGFGVTVHKGRDPESAEEMWNIDRALNKPPRFVGDEDRAILRLLWAPLSATAAALVGEALSEPACELPGDPEQASVAMRSIVAEPLPVLRLQTLGTHGNRSWREYLVSYGGGPFDVALPVFRYADVEVIPDDMRDFSTLASGEMVRIERQRAREDLLMDPAGSAVPARRTLARSGPAGADRRPGTDRTGNARQPAHTCPGLAFETACRDPD